MLHRLIALAPAAALVLGLASACHAQDETPKPAEPAPAEPKKEDAPAPEKHTRKSVGFDAPSEWKSEKVRSDRGPKAAYKLAKAEGDSDPANVTLWWFPKSKGWDDNAERFSKMFGSTRDKVTTDHFDAGGFKVTTGEVTGTYKGSGKKAEPKSGFKGISAYVEGPDGAWVTSIIGPEKTVDKHKDAFLKYVKTAHPMDRAEDEAGSGKGKGKGKKGDAKKDEEKKKDDEKKDDEKKSDEPKEGGDMGGGD